MSYRFFTVDAFTDRMFEGANIAVLPEATGLTDVQMQRIAREFNLSETVFILPPLNPANACRIRTFTPLREVAFAGHPTLAAAHVLASIGVVGQGAAAEQEQLDFVVEQNVGPIDVSVRMRRGRPELCQFGLETHFSVDRFVPTEREHALMLGLSESDLRTDALRPLVVACDRPYLIIPLTSFAAVRAARFDHDHWSRSTAVSLSREVLLVATRGESGEADYHCRLVGPDIGIHEDPPIGSAMPAFCGYLSELRGASHEFTAERGAGAARRSLLRIGSMRVDQSDLAVKMGGGTVSVSQGTLFV